jgi:hypothetical protein
MAICRAQRLSTTGRTAEIWAKQFDDGTRPDYFLWMCTLDPSLDNILTIGPVGVDTILDLSSVVLYTFNQ